MDNQLNSTTPEQQLRSLVAMLRTPVETIRGFAEIIKLHCHANNSESQMILNAINPISDAANQMKEFLDETIRTDRFYTPSRDLSSTDIFLGLRQKLVDARENSDINTLRDLMAIFFVLDEIVTQKGITGRIFWILNNFRDSAIDSIGGVPWKSTIPSEEEIISALNRN